MVKKNKPVDWADINIQANIMVALVLIAGLLTFIVFKLVAG
jgi:hypothetical protein